MNCPYLSSKHCNFMSRYTTCRGRSLSENPTYCAFWSVFGATCLSLQPLASSVGFGTTARVAPGQNLPDSAVTSEPVGCYATPVQLGGGSGICRTTRAVTCYEEAGLEDGSLVSKAVTSGGQSGWWSPPETRGDQVWA